ncbi:conserved hypothetical protein [Ricinus communis]|uniref:Uncharacterized protein n=1 Tax=Ricinus communis TaxID=3988 RepID=B9RJ20_RICCO|nr:conserved hypothetical protein [Ricinus communis]
MGTEMAKVDTEVTLNTDILARTMPLHELAIVTMAIMKMECYLKLTDITNSEVKGMKKSATNCYK